MNANNLQVGSTKMDRLILLAGIVTLVALASLRGYGVASAFRILLRVADVVVNALVAFVA